ncbi:MAG: cobalamin biosynthesis protein [Parabacteroides merdae]
MRQRYWNNPVPHPSSTVKKATGSGSVAEAAAILSAEGGPLLVGKQKGQTKDSLMR